MLRDDLADLVQRRLGQVATLIWVTSCTVSRSRHLANFLQLAPVQDRDPVADVLHVGQQVAREHDRLALLTKIADQFLDLGRADRVQPRGRLVEQDQLRVVDQRLGQPDPPLHALGILPQLPLLGRREPDHVDQPPNPLGSARRRRS